MTHTAKLIPTCGTIRIMIIIAKTQSWCSIEHVNRTDGLADKLAPRAGALAPHYLLNCTIYLLALMRLISELIWPMAYLCTYNCSRGDRYGHFTLTSLSRALNLDPPRNKTEMGCGAHNCRRSLPRRIYTHAIFSRRRKRSPPPPPPQISRLRVSQRRAECGSCDRKWILLRNLYLLPRQR